MKQQLFVFHGYRVRTVTINDEPFFVGKDIATILGYKSPSVAISKNVPDKYKGVTEMETPGGKQKLVIISETGLYKLAFKSHVPQAERFTDWIASEVLPAIRKHGAYMTPEKIEEVLTDPDTIINLATQLKRERQQRRQLQAENQVMKPKAIFADAVTASHSSILVGQLAKLLRQNGVDTGQNRLFAWLRDNGYLGKRGSNRNVPTQYAMELGLFKTKETAVTHSDGHTTVQITTKVTGKGQQYFINKFLGKMISVE